MRSPTLLTHGAETDPSGGRGPAGDQTCGQHAEGGGPGVRGERHESEHRKISN